MDEIREETEINNNSQKTKLNGKKIAKIAIFVAISFLIGRFLEFPIIPQVSFLKFDFSLVFIMIAAFMFGPVEGIIIILLKNLLCLTATTSGGIGELANFLIELSFIAFPSFMYRRLKGKKYALILMLVGSFIAIAMSLIVNRFITFPLYFDNNARDMFNSLVWFMLLFNVIKYIVVSIITMFLYKRIKKVLSF